MSSIREQIAAKRAQARSAQNSPAAKSRQGGGSFGSPELAAQSSPSRSYASPRRHGAGSGAGAAGVFGATDELLEENSVSGQVGKARRSGKLDIGSLNLTTIAPQVYMDLLGLPEEELSVPPVKHVAEPRPRAPGDGEDFDLRLADLRLAQDEDAQRRAFGTPEPKRQWSEPEELTAFRAADNRIERLELEIGLFGGLKTLDLRNNQLEVLPDAIADLLRLTWIDLSHNKLAALPPTLLLLPELESVNLSNNQIDTIDLTAPVKPSDIGMGYGTGFLMTSFERQARAPKTVFPVLRSLNLAHNIITVAGLAGLAGKARLRIRGLNLINNNLAGVLEAGPAGIDAFRMPELASLSLGDNKHLNDLKGDIAPGCVIDTEGCAWGRTGGSAMSLGASPRKPRAASNGDGDQTEGSPLAGPSYVPEPGGPNEVPSPILTLPFVTHPAATFDSEPLALGMDIYLPPAAVSSPTKPHAIVVWFHGGGLLQGNKENLPPHLRRLPSKAVKGDEHVIVVSPNYRLAPQAAIIDILNDADSAVNFVRTKLNDRLAAAGHGARVDPSRVLLSGGSAGGYLAMILGLPTPKYVSDADVGGHRGPVGYTPLGIAPFYPITDLEHQFWQTKTDPVPWWGQSVPDSVARPHLNHRDPPVGSAVSGGPRSILYMYMLQHALFPNLLFYNQRSRGGGLDGYRPSPESMGVTTRLKFIKKYNATRPPIYMAYGTVDDKIQPLEETAQLIKDTQGGAVIEVIPGADHAYDENAAEQCAGFQAWLKSLL